MARQFDARIVVAESIEGAAAVAGADEPLVLAIDRLAAGPAELAEPATLPPDAPLVISLGSGTTGVPRGALVTHEQQLARFQQHWLSQEINGRDRFLAATPLRLGAARAFSMGMLYAGGTVILAPLPQPPHELVRLADEQRATVIFLVPELVRRLLATAPDGARPLFGGVRHLLVGGSPLDIEEPAAITARLARRFLFNYATAECGLITVATPEDLVRRPGSVGQPGVEVELQIVDDAGRAVEPGVVGRLRCRGPAVPTTFLTAAGEASSTSEGWYYPGDLGRLDEGGFVYIDGRVESRIMRRGVAVLPEAVERVLRADPEIVDACVTPWPRAELANYDPDPQLAAFVIVRDGADADAAVRRASAALPAHERPSLVVTLPSFPMTVMGKIQRDQLARQLPAR